MERQWVMASRFPLPAHGPGRCGDRPSLPSRTGVPPWIAASCRNPRCRGRPSASSPVQEHTCGGPGLEAFHAISHSQAFGRMPNAAARMAALPGRRSAMTGFQRAKFGPSNLACSNRGTGQDARATWRGHPARRILKSHKKILANPRAGTQFARVLQARHLQSKDTSHSTFSSHVRHSRTIRN